MTLLRSSSRLLAVFSLALLGDFVGSAPAHAAPKSGVVAGSGTTAGGVFTAGPSGAEYQLLSQARLKLAPGAAIRVFPMQQQLQLAPGAKTATYSFALLGGRVDVSVPSKPKSAVLCSADKVVVVVSSGGDATILGAPGSATVVGNAGDVRTLVGDRWQTLTPATLSRFRGGHASAPEPVIAAPTLAPGQRLWFSPGEPVAVSGFSFNAVSGAARYELTLRRRDGGAEQLRVVRNATRLTEAFAPIATGEYLLAVRSVDAEGVAGRWSASEPLRVVGVALPPGGYAAGGDIFIGKGQEVRFSNTEGLEMTYEGAGRYIPASEAVTLYRGETTVVSFRVPGSVYPTTARLRPRSLYAQVTIGPSRAVWPKDPVQIVVELKNKGDESVPDWVELKPDVRLGIEPVDVSFTRDGNRLVGNVPPPVGAGPWVLRVEVKDQFGAMLGRDFLEIAKAPLTPPSKVSGARVASK